MANQKNELHTVRLSLCRRIVEHARNGTTDVAPGVMFNDVSAYTDPDRYELEMEKLFRGMPQVACLSSDLPKAGSYRLFDDTGVPIFVIRGKDGVVRAFLNICPHRGARLMRESAGCANRLTCRFHGWSFNTEGSGAVVPQKDYFCDLVENYQQLIPCPAAERHGLVFVKPEPNSTMDIDDHLGDFGAELAKLDLGQAHKICEGEIGATCNWKYAFDTYFENYHFQTLHRLSVAPLFVNDIMLYDTWGPHHRVVFPPREAADWSGKPESEWLVDTLGTPYFIFPNTVLYIGSLTPDRLYINMMRMYPRGVDKLFTRIDSYAPGGSPYTEDYRTEVKNALQAIIKLLKEEDYDVTAESWKNFLSLPAGSKILFGRQELALQHVHSWVAKSLGLPEPEVRLPGSETEQSRSGTGG